MTLARAPSIGGPMALDRITLTHFRNHPETRLDGPARKALEHMEALGGCA